MSKFQYGIDFQWEILKYTLKDSKGYKALGLFHFNNFELNYQQIIARGIQRFYRRRKKMPSNASILNEELRSLFRTSDYAQSLTKEDRSTIQKKVRRLYRANIKDGDEILEKCKEFASYKELTKVLENIDPTNFAQYQTYSKKIQNAINIGMSLNEDKGSFVVAAHPNRFKERRHQFQVAPTPYKQLNALTNADGFGKGSVLVFLDKPKGGKTAFLISFARELMLSGKKVIYFDYENGEDNLGIRVDQGLVHATKKEILTGRWDLKLKKKYRRIKREKGGEIYIKRMDARSTIVEMQQVLDDLENEYGLKFDNAFVDYVGLMGASNGAKDDEPRISQAFIDVKNWAKNNDFDYVITGHHVIRKAYERRGTKYRPNDTAKCIEINRHVDGVYGIQQNATEQKSGVIRIEIIEQRDGEPFGAGWFHMDLRHQKFIEFTDMEVDVIKKKRR